MNPDIDWQRCPLLALLTPEAAVMMAVGRVDHRDCSWNVPGASARQ